MKNVIMHNKKWAAVTFQQRLPTLLMLYVDTCCEVNTAFVQQTVLLSFCPVYNADLEL